MYLKDISKVYRIINTIWENNTSKIVLIIIFFNTNLINKMMNLLFYN